MISVLMQNYQIHRGEKISTMIIVWAGRINKPMPFWSMLRALSKEKQG